MPGTTLQDVIVPELFNPYVINPYDGTVCTVPVRNHYQ